MYLVIFCKSLYFQFSSIIFIRIFILSWYFVVCCIYSDFRFLLKHSAECYCWIVGDFALIVGDSVWIVSDFADDFVGDFWKWFCVFFYVVYFQQAVSSHFTFPLFFFLFYFKKNFIIKNFYSKKINMRNLRKRVLEKNHF